jgi:hypothetical protein
MKQLDPGTVELSSRRQQRAGLHSKRAKSAAESSSRGAVETPYTKYQLQQMAQPSISASCPAHEHTAQNVLQQKCQCQYELRYR